MITDAPGPDPTKPAYTDADAEFGGGTCDVTIERFAYDGPE